MREGAISIKRLVFCVLLVGALLSRVETVLGQDSPALRSPPANYQKTGTCIPGVGRPHMHTRNQLSNPILFYGGSGLTRIVYLLKERDIQDGRAVTLLGDLGGLPVTTFSFAYTPKNPFGGTSAEGPFYLLSIHLQTGQSQGLDAC